MCSLMSTSSAATAAHCSGCGAQTNVYCCSIVSLSMIAAGPCTKPSRQPVTPYVLLKPSTTIV